MFTISSQSDYGLIILSYLRKKTKLISLAELVNETKLPQRYLARIASELTKNELLTSKEGRDGGYRLTKKINSISFFDYLRIFEKEVETCRCGRDDECDYEKVCKHKSFLQNKLNKILTKQLKEIKLTDIFS